MSLTKKQQDELFKLLEEETEYWNRNRLKIYMRANDYEAPDGTVVWGLDRYPKFREFYRAGKHFRQRSIVAANRVGKTFRALSEIVLHCTQDYPDDWEGRKFDRPLKIFICGDRGDTVKRVFQPLLLGDPDQFNGLIPKANLGETKPLAGIPGGIGEYRIRNKKGGVSVLQVITYNSGREAYEGFKADIVYLDEECPRDILTECLLRTMTVKDSMIIATFTPDRGLSETYIYFTNPDNSMRVFNTNVTWDDVPHLTDSEKSELLASMAPQERECRSKGIPYLGKGKIYQFFEDDFTVDPFKIPDYWPRVYGMDVGYSHPTAVVWGAWDRDSDVLYLYSCHKAAQLQPSAHANAILARGKWIPGIIDTSSAVASQTDGGRLIDLYDKFGLDLTFVKKGQGSVEEGILEISDRLESGRLKVFKPLIPWLEEYRLYRRDDNSKIVKKNDDLMDATRYLIRSGLEIATVQPLKNRTEAYSDMGSRDPFTGY